MGKLKSLSSWVRDIFGLFLVTFLLACSPQKEEKMAKEKLAKSFDDFIVLYYGFLDNDNAKMGIVDNPQEFKDDLFNYLRGGYEGYDFPLLSEQFLINLENNFSNCKATKGDLNSIRKCADPIFQCEYGFRCEREIEIKLKSDNNAEISVTLITYSESEGGCNMVKFALIRNSERGWQIMDRTFE